MYLVIILLNVLSRNSRSYLQQFSCVWYFHGSRQRTSLRHAEQSSSNVDMEEVVAADAAIDAVSYEDVAWAET